MSQGGPSELRGAQRAAFIAGAARRAFSLDPIADLSQVPELFDGRAESYYVAPALLRADVVLHAVGIHEPASDASAVAVTVRADAGRTVLLLSAYQATSWDVRVEPGASLAGIYLVGHEPCEVRCGAPLRGVVPLTDVPIVHRFDTRDVDDQGARNFLRVVRERTQRPLATFQGDVSRQRVRHSAVSRRGAGRRGRRRACRVGARIYAPITGAVLAGGRRRDRPRGCPRRSDPGAARSARRHALRHRRSLLRRRRSDAVRHRSRRRGGVVPAAARGVMAGRRGV